MHQFYKFEPGQCTCILGDPSAANPQQLNVRKMSGAEVVLDPTDALRERQAITASIRLTGGPSLALSGSVVTSTDSGVFIQWSHSGPKEAQRVDQVLREYIEHPGKKDAAPPHENTKGQSPRHEKAMASSAIDVGATIRSKARTVRTAELASQLETVQVLNITTIKNLIKEAVDESVALLGPNFGEAARQRLLEEAEETFKDRLEVYEAEKAGLEEKTKRLQEQIKRTQALLEEERNKIVSANQFTVSDAGMVELEQRLGRLLDRSIKTGQVSAQVEQEMRSVVSRLLDDERDKIREQAQQAQNDKVALLEKKVERLASSLQNAEGERDRAQRRAQALEASGGLPLRNIMTVGLDQGDPDRERKLALLKEIFRLNKEIREELASKGLLSSAHRDPPEGQEADGPAAGSRAQPETTSEASAAGAEQADESGHGEEATEGIPVLAAGGEADPDDLPWEPPQSPQANSKAVKIKSLKGSSKGFQKSKKR